MVIMTTNKEMRVTYARLMNYSCKSYKEIGQGSQDVDIEVADEQTYNSDSVVGSLFVRAFASLPIGMRLDLGHEFENFVKGCTYRGQDCSNESCEIQRSITSIC